MGHGQRFFSSRAAMGFVILSLGVVLLLDNVGLVNSDRIFQFWPLILVGWGLSMVLRSAGPHRRLFGGVVSVAGLVLLLTNLDVWDVHLGQLWPLALIFLGLALLAGARMGGKGTWGKGASTDAFVRRWVALGGAEHRNDSRSFEGGELSAVMGGLELDLRAAQMQGDEAVLDLFAMMGAIELKVPPDWCVVTDVVAFMGALEDKTTTPPDLDHGEVRPRLVLKGFAIMGGIEVQS